MKYVLNRCADSFYITEDGADIYKRDGHPEAFISGSYSRDEEMEGGWKRRVNEPVTGAREFAEKIVAALNAFEAASAATPLAAE